MHSSTKRDFIKLLGSLGVTAAAAPYALTSACGDSGKYKGERSGSHGENDGSATPSKTARPSYLALHESGELKKRGETLWNMMESCTLCPRSCGANRLAGESGYCGASDRLVIASYHPHFGEEESLVGSNGSGAIFLSHCGLRCVFCINSDISHGGEGSEREISDLALMMLALQKRGCHNINIVTPTHYSPHILLALDAATEMGLGIPLVYNTCGWEKTDVLRHLDGVVDIYLPDFKYWDGEMAAKYSDGAETYPETTKKALLEMNRQVGPARPDDDGIMRRGLMIRHLVMPGGVSGSEHIMDWIAGNLPKDTYVNIMSQYRPMFRAAEYPDIDRRVRRKEFQAVVEKARDAGLTNLDIQPSPFL